MTIEIFRIIKVDVSWHHVAPILALFAIVWASLKLLPLWAIIPSVAIPVLLCIIYLRYRQVHAWNPSSKSGTFLSVSSRQPIGLYSSASVLWQLYGPLSFSPGLPLPQELFIARVPKCPNCRTELKVQKRFTRGFKWACIREGCGFTKKSPSCFNTESDNALKLARADLERGQLRLL